MGEKQSVSEANCRRVPWARGVHHLNKRTLKGAATIINIMKISGFTFVKDAVKFDFPIVECIRSMLPVVDEVIVNVGVSEDGTLELIRQISNPKITIFETLWEPEKQTKGRILAEQTNLALARCNGDWCLYLQADEVLHENDYERIYNAACQNLEDTSVEGLSFHYYHFWGDWHHYIRSYHWYQNEIRIIRNRIGVSSYSSAGGFRISERKLRAKHTDAYIYHYGWVRPPEIMAKKKRYHDTLHHGDGWRDERYSDASFDFVNQIDPFALTNFRRTHPLVMAQRIANRPVEYDFSKSKHHITSKDRVNRITDIFARTTGIRPGEYRNYRLL